MTLLAAMAGLVLRPGHAETASISIWQFGGLKLRLEARGDERSWLFDEISADVAARDGIAPGAIFWQGQRVGDRLEGEAFLYGAGCQPVGYRLNGSAKLNGSGEIVLRGSPPERVGGTCAIKTPARPTAIYTLKLIGKPRAFRDEE